MPSSARSGSSPASGDHVDATTDQLTLGGGAAHVWDVGRLALELGAGAGAALLREGFESRGEAPTRWTAAGFAGGGGGASLELGGGVSLALEVAAEAWLFRRADAGLDERLGVSFAARVGLGLGWRL